MPKNSLPWCGIRASALATLSFSIPMRPEGGGKRVYGGVDKRGVCFVYGS